MKLSFASENYELTKDLERYAAVKVQRLVRLIPRGSRPLAGCHVVFHQRVHRGIKHSTCKLIIHIDANDFVAEETTQHMYAAVDIASTHIEYQLKDYAAREKKRRLRRIFRRPT